MARLLVSLLGPFQVTLDGKPVTTFESAKARALLAFLATEAEHAHSRETLAELLWPERPPGAALADLRHALANLRKALSDATAQPPFLLITQTTLQFNTASDATIDVVDFVALLKHGSAATVADCQTALTMLHGTFLDGFKLSDSPQFEEWMVVTAEQVAHLARQASGRLADDCEEHGDYVQAAVWTRQQLALEPWNEEVHQRLIRQLASSGQRSVALHQYDICRRMLAVELGVEPQSATQALVAAIRDGDEELPPLAPQASGAQLGGRPPPSSASPRIGGRGADPSRPDYGRLPPQSSAFFGRDAELEQVATRLADPACRLLTVLGPGGMGKSRLAIQAAGALSEHFADGVWFVDLAPLNAPDQIAGAILRVFGLPPASPDSAAARLQEWLSGRQALLVLDNFEHLLAGANLLPVLLQATPALRLMVTSRARLHLADEWLLPLAGLETPAAPPSMGSTVTRFDHEPEDLSNVASVRLFLQQVQRLDPGYEPTPADLGQIGEICRLLEGMPLAIELAAAWIRTLALCEIAHAVYNRLELFAATLRDIPARHRSMHAVFDHSWRLLDERERSLLRQLAVFRGGWTLAAAETVAGTTFIELENLVDKSWLRLHDRRFSLHELMRQFCVAKLAEEHSAATGESSARVHQRHCAYFAGLTNAEDQALNWRREPMVLFNAEFGNLEAAWRWAIDQGELSAIRQMMIGLFFVAEMTGSCGAMLPYFEDAARELRSRRQNTELTSDQRKEAGLVLSTILYIQVILLFHVGRMAEARVCVNGMHEIVATADPDIRWTEQEFLMRWATICLNLELGHFAEVDTAAPDLLIFVRTNDFPCYPWRPEIGTRFWQMQLYHIQGVVARHMGNYATAMQHSTAAIDLCTTIGEGRHNARNLRERAVLMQLQGEIDQARDTIHRALERNRSFGDRINAAYSKLRLGEIELEAGHPMVARDLALHCLAEAQATDEYVLHLYSRLLLARCDRMGGDLNGARSQLEEATRLASQPAVADARGGSALALEWGHLTCAMQNWHDARRHYATALTDAHCYAAEAQSARAGLAEVAWAEHDADEATNLLAAVIAHPATSAATRSRAQMLLADWVTEQQRIKV